VKNRAISPASIWFLIVPIINFFMGFVIVYKIVKSLDREFKQRNIKYNPGIDWFLGVVWWFIVLVSGFVKNQQTLGIVVLILWIAYWIRMVRNLKVLTSSGMEDYLLKKYEEKPGMGNVNEKQEVSKFINQCSNCGNEISDNDKFCGWCGMRID
jgi:hypothetical protein